MKKNLVRIILITIILLFVWIMFKACSSNEEKAVKQVASNFINLALKNPKEAFAEMSDDYQLLAEYETFAYLIETMHLKDLKKIKWTNFLLEENLSSLNGTVTLKNNKSYNISITLVKVGRKWRVVRLSPLDEIELNQAVISNSNSSLENKIVLGNLNNKQEENLNINLPVGSNTSDMNDLAIAHLYALAAALSVDDFSGFYSMSAKVWQSQTNAKSLKEAYSPLKKHTTLLLDLLASGKLTLHSANTNKSSADLTVLTLVGEIKKNTNTLNFTLHLTQQHNRWTMVGLEAALY